MGGRRKGAVHFLHLARRDQGAHVNFVILAAAVVGDAREAFGSLTMDGSQKVSWDADATKSGGHEHRSIGDVRDGLIERWIHFVFHGCYLQIGLLKVVSDA